MYEDAHDGLSDCREPLHLIIVALNPARHYCQNMTMVLTDVYCHTLHLTISCISLVRD